MVAIPPIDPGWSFLEAAEAAYATYTGDGLLSTNRRMTILLAWANVVGRQRATDDLHRFKLDCGNTWVATAQAMRISTQTLKGLRTAFDRAPFVTQPRLYLGQLIHGVFRVEQVLGEGKAGVAYQVVTERQWQAFEVGTRLCLKWYKDEVFSKEEERVAVFRRIREARLGGQIEHPNVVRVIDSSEFDGPDGPRFLLMHLLEGKSLRQFVACEAPNPTTIRSIFSGLCTGVEYLHSNGIIHRDIKVDNILIVPGDRPVILDLGVVRPSEEQTITSPQSFLGTLRYAAPEWLLGDECTTASDVYSLGTVLYHLIAGHEVFSEITLFSRLVIAVRQTTPILSAVLPELEDLAHLCMYSLRKNPALRPTMPSILGFLRGEKLPRVPTDLAWLDLVDAFFNDASNTDDVMTAGQAIYYELRGCSEDKAHIFLTRMESITSNELARLVDELTDVLMDGGNDHVVEQVATLFSAIPRLAYRFGILQLSEDGRETANQILELIGHLNGDQ